MLLWGTSLLGEVYRLRLLICGDRFWGTELGPDGVTRIQCVRDWDTMFNAVKELHSKLPLSAIIEGEAKGADKMGAMVAAILEIPVMKFPADWGTHGKAAGPIRNQQMLTFGKPDLVFAFHHDIRNSKGTKDMVARAKKAKVPGRIYG